MHEDSHAELYMFDITFFSVVHVTLPVHPNNQTCFSDETG